MAGRDFAERFWGGVGQFAPEGCWTWRGLSRTENPRVRTGWYMVGGSGAYEYAATIAWYLCRGDVPAGQEPVPGCGSWNCVRPDHLVLRGVRTRRRGRPVGLRPKRRRVVRSAVRVPRSPRE